MSLIEEGNGKRVRMAHLAIVGSHTVNGVAALHTEILKSTVFSDFHEFWPDKFVSITNGVTPRRWVRQANQGLSDLLDEALGESWSTDLDRLAELRPLAGDAAFRARWAAVKRSNKERLAAYVRARTGVELPTDFLFDVQVKRIHEYKRQILNVLHAAWLYNRIRSGQTAGLVPRAVIFGGKAAPSYALAKLSIKLMHSLAAAVNSDPRCKDLLRVVFVPNYCVSNAEKIVPAAELSEQISTAGYEASGTGNMKFALNGALTIGTRDGATVEMAERIGEEYFFLFGLSAEEVRARNQACSNPRAELAADPELAAAVAAVAGGCFGQEVPGLFAPILDSLMHCDRFLVLTDFHSYRMAQERAAALYLDKQEWNRWSVMNTAGMGYFSSDRAIREYAEKVWGIPLKGK